MTTEIIKSALLGLIVCTDESDVEAERAANRQAPTYRDLPNGAGMFGAVMIEDVLRRADVAVSSSDVVAMLRSWGEMKDCK